MLAVLASRGIVLSLLLLSAILSGCSGSSGDTLATPSGFDDAVAIRGRVVSDEVFPVVGGTVSVENGPTATTDEEGRFELVGITPGAVVLTVSASGYETLVKTVEVSPDSAAEVLIVLTGIPGEAPYFTTQEFTGFIACGWSIIFGAGWYPFTPCPFGANADHFVVEVGPDWRGGVHEMTWEGAEEMLLASSLVPSCANNGAAGVDPCPAVLSGKSPLRVIARPEDAEYAQQHSIDGAVTWPASNHTSHLLTAYTGHYRTEINATLYPLCVIVNTVAGSPPEWGCPFGAGVATGLRSEIYHTTFYRAEPPALEAYSAIPDG